MPKYNIEYEAYCDGRFAFYVLCSSPRTGRQALCWVDREGSIRTADDFGWNPRIVQLYPIAFDKLPAVARASVRNWAWRLIDTRSMEAVK